MVRKSILLFACVFVLPTTAWAQASLAGVVRDESGGVLPGVSVEAASPALIEGARTVTTDEQGRYRIEALRPGSYKLTFTLSGSCLRAAFRVENTVAIGHELGAEFAVYWPGSLGYYVQGAIDETERCRPLAERTKSCSRWVYAGAGN